MKKLFRYFMLFVFLWGITSQIEAKDKHFIIQGIEYRLSKIVDNLYCAVDNLHPEQMKDSTSLVIPAYVSYKGKSYPVTFCSLNSDVAKNIRYLTIPKTLRIGKHDFRNFTSLLSVSFEDGVERIGDFAFYQLPELHWVDLPNSIKEIGSYAFAFCYKLTEIYGLTSKITIHNRVFDSWGETPFSSAFYTLKANNFEYGGLFKTFSEYAKPLIEEDIKNWQKKSEFEKQSEWKKRVTAVNQNLKVKELTKEYKSKYLNTNKRVDLRYILAAYDPENETFPVYIKNVDTLFIKVGAPDKPCGGLCRC